MGPGHFSIVSYDSASTLLKNNLGTLSRLLMETRQGLADAVEHRHGKQRVPLLSGGVGSSVCVNDINADELKGAIAEAWSMHGHDSNKNQTW